VAFRARKSIKLGPGVRLNVSHRGASVRIGGRGGGVSLHSSGRKTVSAGIPGSGLGYSKSYAGGRGRSRRTAPVPVAPPSPRKPGMLASAYEKTFYKGCQAIADGKIDEGAALFREASAKDGKDKSLADDLLAGMFSAQLNQDDAAIPYLEKVVASNQALPDALMQKYLPGGGVYVPVTENVGVEVPFSSLAAALTLAEVYQRNGRTGEAIGLLQQLVEVEPHPFLVLSLCDLYAEVGAWDELVEVAGGATNEDDVSCQVKVYLARAFEEQGLNDAALEAYKDALKSKKRDPGLLKDARYRRARVYERAGKASQAKKELEKLYAEDPSYRDVAELVRGSDA
jgi:tetratricopeptide (TPR) repeat protein